MTEKITTPGGYTYDEPITEATFKGLAQDLLGLLIDASDGTDEDEDFLD